MKGAAWIRGVALMAGVTVWGCAPERDSVIQSGDLASRIEASLDALNAKTSFYAKHLPSGREIAIRADEPMNALSVIKIPIMVLAYRDADAGALDLEERYQIQPEDMRRGSGLLQSFAPGIEPTYRDIITQMIITSDNTATDVVIKRLGLGRVNTMLEELGFEQTRLRATTGELFRAVLELADSSSASLSDREVFESGFPSDPESAVRSFGFEGDSTQWLGRITAREISHMLEAIEEGEWASPESSDEMIGILRRQFYSSRLPQQLRGKASIAHKTGDWPPHAGNDVGILYYEGGPTVVAVFTNQNQGDFFELEAALGRIAVDLVDSWH
ncbi:MAG: class A beta-lactamase-related serine hydrolase [Gemmatimonadetes bacterium]|nr:class A beta-lactamase-related serine hydrolase [Gemmatimonadota bacterium]